jgi:hypothetical protein
MLNAFHDRFSSVVDLAVYCALDVRVHFVGYESQFIGFREQDVECGFQFETGLEYRAATQNVKAKAGPGKGNGEAADVTEVANCLGPDKGEYDICTE